MKKIIFVLLILALVDKLDAQVKQPAPLIISNITLSSPKLITAIDDLICTNLESQPVVITGNAQVEYKAEGAITLLPGFEVSALNQNTEHFFWAHIEPMGNPEAIICYPHKAVNPNDGMVHVNKWEKLELGFKLPDAYKAGVDAFFFHYYNGQSVPADDLNPYADDSLLFKATFKRPDGTSIIKYGFFMRESKWGVNLNSEPEEDLTHVFYDYFWRVRFAPDKDDANIPWTAIMELAAPKSSQITFPPLTFNSLTFICDPPLPDNHGYLTVNQNNNRYLQFEDGTSFFGIGANLCDQRHNYNPALHWNRFLKVDYNNFLQAFNQSAAAGGNFFRMIFLKSLFLPEYEHLGVYDKFINTVPECAPYCISAGWDHNRNGNRQYSAWILDKMLDKAKDTKIYLHLTLEYANNGGAYQMMHWGDNCYARKYLYPTGTFNQNINGIDYFDGPYNSKELFISSNVSDPTNEGVMYFWKRRYKYIMSRWSYSTNIAAFDSFNELESMPGANTSGTMDAFSTCSNNLTPTPFNQDVVNAIYQWHDIIIPFAKQLDNNKHLFSIQSYSDVASSSHPFHQLQFKPYFNLTDVHNYSWLNDREYNKNTIFPVTNEYASIFTKPFQFGESGHFQLLRNSDLPSGISYPGIESERQTNNLNDNFDIDYHNLLWSSTLSGNYKTASTWFWQSLFWWDDSNPNIFKYNKVGLGNIDIDIYNQIGIGNVWNFGQGITSFINRNYHHNFTPLRNFMDMIDLNDTYTYHYTNNDSTEAIYMRSCTTQKIYGWVHNMKHYWGNKWAAVQDANISLHNYYGCTSSPSTFTINGMQSNNQQCHIEFYPTRPGSGISPPHVPYTYTCGASDVCLDVLVSIGMGCDTVNADMAFIVTPLPAPQNKLANNTITSDSIIDKSDVAINTITVLSNPSGESTTIVMDGATPSRSLSIINVMGGVVFAADEINTNYIQVPNSILASGTYIVICIDSENRKITKKIIVL